MSQNATFIKILEKVQSIKSKKGDFMGSKAAQRAVDALILYNKEIETPEELKAIKNVGASTVAKYKEFMKTGTLKFIENFKNDPINLFTNVYGIGPKKAAQLVNDDQVTTISELREHQDHLLNDVQKKGLKYYEDILKRIPRLEIEHYRTKMSKIKIATDFHFEIVGSYRRGADNSGDIDVIITSSYDNRNVFDIFIDMLVKKGIIIDLLSKGKKKSLTVGKLRGHPARRLDFMFTTKEEYPFAVLYFTGSKIFNTLMRSQALKLGYTMNEHGLHTFKKGVKGAKIDRKFKDEKDIFDFLNIKWVEPEDRETAENFKVFSKRKNKTRKKKHPNLHKLVMDFVRNSNILEDYTEEQLTFLVREANIGYYNNNQPIMSDAKYDYLIDFIKENYPQNKVVDEGHSLIKIDEDRKMKLPYEMWSMDKIKKEDKVNKKANEWKGTHIISAKLDGCSMGYSTENGKLLLYTRGNGKVGQNVTHLAPYLNLPNYPGISVRGEILISKQLFAEKYSDKFANPRNFVSGILNAKSVDPNVVKDLTFVAYELIEPVRRPIQQLKMLKKIGFNVVKYVATEGLKRAKNPFNALKSTLLDWKQYYEFEIDGIIITQDRIVERISGNPKHAWAFKIITDDQIAQTVVEEVIWSPSKDGYLKPKIKVKPVNLCGATITYVTVHNELYRRNNGIDVGAVVEIIRSGDVIPKVHNVITPVEIQPPPEHYNVELKGVDYVLTNPHDDMTVRLKMIHAFFVNIGVVGLGRGNVQRIMNAGFTSVQDILNMTIDDFLTVEGFKEKTANKIRNSIQKCIIKSTLPELLVATNILGRGMGLSRVTAILEKYPDILISDESDEIKLKNIAELPGFKNKTAMLFVPHIKEFVQFMTVINQQNKLKYVKHTNVNIAHPLYSKKIVLTGFRDKKLEEQFKTFGIIISNQVNSKTHLVLVKNKNHDSSKVNKAKELNIPIFTIKEFTQKYF
jgi:NAD-dependent DNA ligase/DNA polymerase/3'-5' exonuclease PolX